MFLYHLKWACGPAEGLQQAISTAPPSVMSLDELADTVTELDESGGKRGLGKKEVHIRLLTTDIKVERIHVLTCRSSEYFSSVKSLTAWLSSCDVSAGFFPEIL